MRLGPTGTTKKNGSGVTTGIDQYRTLDIVTDGMTTIRTGMREAATITMISMIKITSPTTIDDERSNGETMKTSVGKVTGTTDALTRNETHGKRVIGSWPRSTNRSRTEA